MGQGALGLRPISPLFGLHSHFFSRSASTRGHKHKDKKQKWKDQPSGRPHPTFTSPDCARTWRGWGHKSATQFCVCLSDNDSPRCSHPGDRASSFSQCHCTACGTGSPSLSCCIFLALQRNWSASDCQSQPEAIDNGHCRMETIPQHLKKVEAREENGYLELKLYNWRWIMPHLSIGLNSATFYRYIMECPL